MPAWIVYVGLIAISWVHDEIINLVNDATGGKSPWTAFFVVAGVLYTILAAYLIDGPQINVWTLLFCFAASGLPMTIGDVVRYTKTR